MTAIQLNKEALELARQHFVVWGSTRDGMSAGGYIAQAALLNDGQIMLVTGGSVSRNEMPPGFVRFLSEEERREQNIMVTIDWRRVGRKWNSGKTFGSSADRLVPHRTKVKTEPYYRKYDKRN